MTLILAYQVHSIEICVGRTEYVSYHCDNRILWKAIQSIKPIQFV